MADRKPDMAGMAQVFRMVRNSLGYFARKYDLTISEMAIVFDTFYQGQVSLTQLADSLGIPKSTVSRLVERLVQKNYLSRVRPEENRRIVQISITPEFHEKLGQLQDDKAFQKLLEQDLPRDLGQKAIGKYKELVDILEEDMASGMDT